MMGQREPRAVMNRALDNELDPQERTAFHLHLDDVPGDAVEYARLRRVDQMLSSATTLTAPTGFADRMMAALTKRLPPRFDHERGTALALGLYSAFAISVAVLAGGLFGLIALWKAGLFVAAINGGRLLVGQITTDIQSAQASVAQSTNGVLLSVVGAVAIGAAVVLSKVIALPNPDETYRIPVQFST